MKRPLLRPLLGLLLAAAPLASPPAAAQTAGNGAEDEGWTPLVASDAAPAGEDSWLPLDGVVAVAGERAITHSRVIGFIEQQRARMNITTQEDYQRALGQALSALMTLELESQAGRDLGLDPEQVRRMVRLDVEARKSEEGAVAVSEDLRAYGLDAVDALSREVDQVYTSIWRSSIQGSLSKDSGIRPYRDRYVRPGELREIYRVNSVGPTIVTLQILDIRAAQAGGVEPARAYIEDLRQQALDGEDLTLLIVENAASNRAERGMTGRLQADQIPYPGLREFALRGEVGSLSEVLAVTGADGSPGFLFGRLIEREEPEEAPPFLDRSLQQRLRRLYAQRRDDTRLQRARAGLGQQAYLWPGPDEGGPTPAR
jgi:hypothetical protein